MFKSLFFVSMTLLFSVVALAVSGKGLIELDDLGDSVVLKFQRCSMGGCGSEIIHNYSTLTPFKWIGEKTHSMDEANLRSQKVREFVKLLVACYNDSCHSDAPESDGELYCQGDLAQNLVKAVKADREYDSKHVASDARLGASAGSIQMPTILGVLSGRANSGDPKIKVDDYRVEMPLASLYPSQIESLDCQETGINWTCNITVFGRILSMGRRTCGLYHLD